jgi:hypothetical protein
MPKNREKYSAEDQKKIGGRIRAAAKKFGIEVTDKKSDVVEESMDENTEKSVAGIPEKPFKFTQDGVTVTGDGNNTIANPVKAQADDESPEEDKKGDEKEMKSLDSTYAQLKSAIASDKLEDVQSVFNALGTEVEKSFAPKQDATSPADLAAIVKSAVEQAVAPLRVEIATLKAQKSDTVSTGGVVKSKALSLHGGLRPEDLIQKAVQGNQPKQRDPNDNVPMQIRSIARKSTGLQS